MASGTCGASVRSATIVATDWPDRSLYDIAPLDVRTEPIRVGGFPEL
jgi:hypothetical protein